MTSVVSSKGQTVVPKAMRERFGIGPGTTLDWQDDGHVLRVIKLAPPSKLAPRVSGKPLKAKNYAGIDLDKPAFTPLDESRGNGIMGTWLIGFWRRRPRKPASC